MFSAEHFILKKLYLGSIWVLKAVSGGLRHLVFQAGQGDYGSLIFRLRYDAMFNAERWPVSALRLFPACAGAIGIFGRPWMAHPD